MLVVNVGHRDYGYRNRYEFGVTNYMPVTLTGKPITKNYVKGFLLAGGITLAYLFLDPIITEAATPYIDTSPIDKLTDILYDALLKVSLYIATPLFAWSGITLATSGTNAGKRTMAKQIAQWTAIGLGVIVGAPWLASLVYKIWVGIF